MSNVDRGCCVDRRGIVDLGSVASRVRIVFYGQWVNANDRERTFCLAS